MNREIPVVSGGNIAVDVKAVDRGGGEDTRAGRRNRFQLPVEERRPNRGGRVRQHVEYGIALEAIVEDPAAGPDYGFGEDLIGEADPGGVVDAAVVDQAGRISVLPRPAHAVCIQGTGERCAPGVDDRANQGGRTHLPVHRIHRNPASVLQRRLAEPSRLRRLVKRRIEGRSLQRLIKLGLDPIETHAIVHGQFVGDPPGVLEEPLDVPVAILAVQHRVGLREALEGAGEGVREGPIGIERIGRVPVKPDVPVNRGECRLVFLGVMQIDAGLQRVAPEHLGQVVRKVPGVIEVAEGGAGEVRERSVRYATETPVLHQGQLVRFRERHAVGQAQGLALEGVVGRVDVEHVPRGTEDEFVGEGGAYGGRQVGDKAPTGVAKVHGSERDVIVGVPLSIGHVLFALGPEVSGVEPPFIADVIVAAVHLFAAREGVRDLRLVVEVGIDAGGVGLGIEVQDAAAIGTDAVLGDDVSGELDVIVQRVPDGEGGAAAFAGLGEVSGPLEGSGHGDVAEGVGDELVLPFGADEEEKLVFIPVEESGDVDGAADVEARVVTAREWALAVFHVVAPEVGIEAFVLVEPIAGAVEIAGAAFGDDLNLRAGGAAELGRLGVGDYLEFADLVHV